MLVELYEEAGQWCFRLEDGTSWITSLNVVGFSKPLEIKSEPEQTEVHFGEVSEAIRLKQSGFSDETIVDVLKMSRYST